MELRKINTDHYILVDDSPIKQGEWSIDGSHNISQFADLSYIGLGYDNKTIKKITHSTQPLGTPMLFTNAFESDLIISTMGLHNTVIENWGCKKLSLQEVKELIGEVDVEKKIYDLCQSECIVDAYGKPTYDGMVIGISAYNQALEDNKELINGLKAIANLCDSDNPSHESIWRIAYSLIPKTSWQVEFDETGKLKLKQ